MTEWKCMAASLALASVVGACALDDTESFGETESDLTYFPNYQLWSPNGMGNTAPIHVPVCWLTVGWVNEKKIFMDAVRGTWGRASPFVFTENCPTAPWERRVNVQIFVGNGGSSAGNLIKLHIEPVGPEHNFSPDRIRHLAVHEMGHILGFIHEQDSPIRPDTSCSIDSEGNVQLPWPGAIPLGPWDQRSIMHYCGTGFLGEFDRFSLGYLTPSDVDGVRSLYGTKTVRTRGDFHGVADADFGFFRPGTAEWVFPGQPTRVFGMAGDIPVSGDYDGNGKDERAVWRPSNGLWLVDNAITPPIVLGSIGDIPVPADYNGDGRIDRAVYTPSTGMWKIELTPGSFMSVQWGMTGDRPVPGDYDGDGIAEIVVYRNGQWINRNNSLYNMTLGGVGDFPVPGDYASEGRVRPAVWKPASGVWTFAAKPVHHGDRAFFGCPTGSGETSDCNRWKVQWGQLNDVPIPASYNQRGITNIAVWRPNTVGEFHILTVGSFGFGTSGDVPMSKHGPQNLAAFRPALQSSTTWSGDAARAVDRNIDGNFNNNSVSHTAFEAAPWWRVDLGAVTAIGKVVLYNRTDCCSERLANFVVQISNDGINWFTAVDFPGVASNRTELAINNFGRFVRVRLVGTNVLSLAEVEVFAP